MHVFPKAENAASNAICRKLSFELIGETDFDARPAGVVRYNDWAFDLLPEPLVGDRRQSTAHLSATATNTVTPR